MCVVSETVERGKDKALGAVVVTQVHEQDCGLAWQFDTHAKLMALIEKAREDGTWDGLCAQHPGTEATLDAFSRGLSLQRHQ